MPACHIPPKDKKALIDNVGKELVRTHGKRKYYKPAEVRRAADTYGYPIDIHCWAYCIFTSVEDFNTLHEATGDACDYVKMKAEVLADLATAAGHSGFDWIDIDLSWLEWPDIDLSGIFDWFDFS
jgi:hypothetical protein